MHIGKKIKEVMDQRHATVVSVARELGCERTNIYNIFVREDINTRLLQQLSRVLNYDFFSELSQETFGQGPTLH